MQFEEVLNKHFRVLYGGETHFNGRAVYCSGQGSDGCHLLGLSVRGVAVS